MRPVFFALFFAIGFCACDDTRVYEKNVDFQKQVWMIGHKPEFEFQIPDTATRYNVYCTMRNSISYPYSRLFFTYYLQDSLGLVLKKDLVNYTLFDPRTGEPAGTSGLGDIYDHRIPILTSHKFRDSGTHKIKIEQFMRKDTLEGVIAVGVRIERVEDKK